jgi:thiamine transport system substrate-binding protein
LIKYKPIFVLLISIIICFPVVLSFVTGCTRKQESSVRKGKAGNIITILTLNSIRSSGFLKRIIPAFEQTNKCRVEVVSAVDKAELMEIIRKDKEIRKIDLVMGLDNGFLNALDDFKLFTKSSALKQHSVNEQYIFDSEQRAIPYGFGYLCILYNEKKVNPAPESLGELQDARFANQLVVCNPHSSGVGRAAMLWSVALYGNDGFQQFWKSIKKNIKVSRDTYPEALQSLESGECGMTFGFTSTPAWNAETKTNSVPLMTSLMKEGSFLYIEAAAIPEQSGNRQLAEKFLTYLLAPEVQKYIAYDLGIFPANESAPLPEQFISAPYSTNYVNNKLRYENPAANISSWLDIWDRIFSRNLM